MTRALTCIAILAAATVAAPTASAKVDARVEWLRRYDAPC